MRRLYFTLYGLLGGLVSIFSTYDSNVHFETCVEIPVSAGKAAAFLRENVLLLNIFFLWLKQDKLGILATSDIIPWMPLQILTIAYSRKKIIY